VKTHSTKAGSIRVRIALVMSTLLLINAATATASWALSARAARFSDTARASLESAQAVQRASEGVTEFVSDNRALAFSVGRTSKSEYSSEDYGQVIGSERLATRELERVTAKVSGPAAEAANRQWESLRTLSYAWVNAEAEHAGSPLRMSRMSNGTYRATASSNIYVPADLSSLGLPELSRAVTVRGEVLRKATLRTLVRDATAEAFAATQAEARARSLAGNVTLLLVALSLASAVAASAWLYRTIVTPIVAARRFADAVAQGDLNATLERHTTDEIGVLTTAIETMKETLVSRMNVMQELAGAVMVTADDVDVAARHALSVAGLDDDAARKSVPEDLLGVVGHTGTLSKLAAQMLSL